MHSRLRLLGLLTAAIWLGGTVFFTFVVAPGIFQPAMKRLFQDYHVGVIAQMMQARYFGFHLACAGVALCLALAEWWTSKREPRRWALSVLMVVSLLVLAGALWLQPKLNSLFEIKYTSPEPASRLVAAASFPRWHGLSQVLNLLVLGGLVLHVRHQGQTVPAEYFS